MEQFGEGEREEEHFKPKFGVQLATANPILWHSGKEEGEQKRNTLVPFGRRRFHHRPPSPSSLPPSPDSAPPLPFNLSRGERGCVFFALDCFQLLSSIPYKVSLPVDRIGYSFVKTNEFSCLLLFEILQLWMRFWLLIELCLVA